MRGRWSGPSAGLVAIAIAACGGGGQAQTVVRHRAQHPPGTSAGAGGPHAPRGQDASSAGATTTVPGDLSPLSLPHGWTSCAATGAQDAAAVSPSTPGCGFARATEIQVQELLHNEGSTVFNTPESIGVSYRSDPQRLLNCVARKNGPTIICADDGAPWVLVFRPPGQ
jgi:hypothetical protein